MSSRVIFVDLDGTLIDISSRHYRVYEQCVNRFNGQPLPKDVYWREKRNDTSWDELLKMSHIDSGLKKDFLEIFVDNIEKMEQLEYDELFSGVIDALRSLSKNNELYLLSLRRNSKALNYQVDRLGIRKYFKSILSGHSNSKKGSLTKKAEIVGGILKDRDGCIFIGDTEADIVAANTLGAVSVAVTSGIRNNTLLSKYNPTYLISDITRLDEIDIFND